MRAFKQAEEYHKGFYVASIDPRWTVQVTESDRPSRPSQKLEIPACRFRVGVSGILVASHIKHPPPGFTDEVSSCPAPLKVS